MFIRAGYDISYEVPAPVAMICLLYTHPTLAASIRVP